jgi:hypothetical protein
MAIKANGNAKMVWEKRMNSPRRTRNGLLLGEEVAAVLGMERERCGRGGHKDAQMTRNGEARCIEPEILHHEAHEGGASLRPLKVRRRGVVSPILPVLGEVGGRFEKQARAKGAKAAMEEESDP